MPSVAVLATAALVLGPGRERPVVGARVWGVAAEGARAAAWRIETLERQFGSDRALPVGALELTVEQGGRPLATWVGDSGEDGIAEALFEVPEPLDGPLEVRIARGKTLLAEGVILLDPPPALTFERRVVEGTARGEIALQVEIERGVLASPFPGALLVRATRALPDHLEPLDPSPPEGPSPPASPPRPGDAAPPAAPPRPGEPLAGVVLKATAEGAQLLETGLRPTTDANGEARIPLQPTWHSVDLRIEATLTRADAPEPAASGAANPRSVPPAASGAASPRSAPPDEPAARPGGPRKGTWDGSLPVKPGAIWISLDPPPPALVSPAPRERVYVSGLSERGRVFGAVVPLVRSASGLFEGTLDASALARLGVRAVTVAGDAQEVGSGTVTWPVGGARAVGSAARVRRLLDGVPFAERIEKKRSRDARIASIWVALVAAAFEVALLVLHGRASEARLAAHLAAASEDDADRAAAARIAGSAASRAFTLVVAVGLVVLAFCAIAAFAIVH